MNPRHVYTSVICGHPVRIMVTNDGRACGTFNATKQRVSEIYIGINVPEYSVYRDLLHELVEFACHASGAAVEPAAALTLKRDDPARFRFFMDHDLFTKVMEEAGDAFFYAWPSVTEAKKKFDKERKARK